MDPASVRPGWEHMFVSELRSAVAELLEAGVTMNEIAHRLGVARSTVGYHGDILRTATHSPNNKTPSPPRHRGPVAAPGVTRERVRRLLARGRTRADIAETLGLARSTVTYHAVGLGEDIDQECARRYDWQAIKRFYEAGHSARECRATLTPRPGSPGAKRTP